MTKDDCNHEWIPIQTRKKFEWERYVASSIERMLIEEIKTVQKLYCPNCNTYKELEDV